MRLHRCRPSSGVALVAALLVHLREACPAGQLQTAPLVVSCTGTLDASPPVHLLQDQEQHILEIPMGVPDLRVKLASNVVDLDLKLIDEDTGTCIVGPGCLFSEPCANESDYCYEFDGMAIHFGSLHSMSPVEESIWVREPATRRLGVSVHASDAGDGTAYFSHGSFSPCPIPVPGCLLPTSTATTGTSLTGTLTSTVTSISATTRSTTTTTTQTTTLTSVTTGSTVTSTMTTRSSDTSTATDTSTETTATTTLITETTLTTSTTPTTLTATASHTTTTGTTSTTPTTVTTTKTSMTVTDTSSATITTVTVTTTLTSATKTSTTTTHTETHTSITRSTMTTTKTTTSSTTTSTSSTTTASSTTTSFTTTSTTGTTSTSTTSTSTTSTTLTSTITESSTSSTTCSCGDGWVYVGDQADVTSAPDDNTTGVDPDVLAHIVPPGTSLNVAIELIMHADEVPKGEKQKYICQVHAGPAEDGNATTTPLVAPTPCLDGEHHHNAGLLVVLVIALVLLLLALLALIALVLCLRSLRARQKQETDDLKDYYDGELRRCNARLKEERLRAQASEAAAKEVDNRLGIACKGVFDQATSTQWSSPDIIEDLREAASTGKVSGPAFVHAERVLDAAVQALLAQSKAGAELKAKIEDLEVCCERQCDQSIGTVAGPTEQEEELARAREDEMEKLRARVGSLEGQLSEANFERKALEAARADLKQKILDTCSETHAENERARIQLHGRIKELVAQVDSLSAELQAARGERGDVVRGWQREAASQLQAAADERARLERELAEGRGRCEQLAGRLEAAEREKAGAEQHLAACTKHIAGLRAAAQRREDDQAAERAALERRIEQLARLVDSLTAHNGDSDRLVAKLRMEIEQREARLARWHSVGLSSVGLSSADKVYGGRAMGTFVEDRMSHRPELPV